MVDVTNMVVKPSSNEKFKYCLNSIEGMSYWGQEWSTTPTHKPGATGLPNGLINNGDNLIMG